MTREALQAAINRRVRAEELRDALERAINHEERADVLSLVTWFRRSYPTGAARFAYVRQAFARWQRAMPLLRVHRLDPAAVDEVAATLRDELAGRPEVCFAYLFGSVLESAGFRDIDVAIWTAPEAGRIDLDIAGQLTRRLRLPIDVRRINEAPVSFLFHVLRGRPLVVRDDLLLANLIERTAREYHDRAPMLRRAAREAFAG